MDFIHLMGFVLYRKVLLSGHNVPSKHIQSGTSNSFYTAYYFQLVRIKINYTIKKLFGRFQTK